MAEKLVTRELGSRWVPHPASGTASIQNESPRPSQAGGTLRPPPGPPSPSSSSSRPAPRPRLPPHPGAGNAAVGARVHGAGRSPRGRFPPPPQPPPPLTPGTRPGPRGRHRVTQPGAGRGEGRRAAAARSAGDPEGAAEGPGATVPACRVAFGTLPPPLLSRPESVTGIGFQHGGQEAAPRGENIPASPARRRAGQGRRPSEEPPVQTAGSGAQYGRLGAEMTRGTMGFQPPPTQTANPKATGGLGWRVREDASSTQPSARLRAAACKRASRHHLNRDSLGLNYIHLEGIFFLGRLSFTPSEGPPHSGNSGAPLEEKIRLDFQGRPYSSASCRGAGRGRSRWPGWASPMLKGRRGRCNPHLAARAREEWKGASPARRDAHPDRVRAFHI